MIMLFLTDSLDCQKAYGMLRSQYGHLKQVKVDAILPTLFQEEVVTMEQKQSIEAAGLKGMEMLLDEILQSLNLGFPHLFIGFRKTLKGSDNILLQELAKRLCKYILIHKMMGKSYNITIVARFMKKNFNMPAILYSVKKVKSAIIIDLIFHSTCKVSPHYCSIPSYEY